MPKLVDHSPLTHSRLFLCDSAPLREPLQHLAQSRQAF